MKQTPAEKAHDRLLAEVHADFKDVSYEDFLAAARRSGTENVPQIRDTIERLRRRRAREQNGD